MPSAILMMWPPFQNETYGDGEHMEKMWRFCQPRLDFPAILPNYMYCIAEMFTSLGSRV